jgi:hypothetical protein
VIRNASFRHECFQDAVQIINHTKSTQVFATTRKKRSRRSLRSTSASIFESVTFRRHVSSLSIGNPEYVIIVSGTSSGYTCHLGMKVGSQWQSTNIFQSGGVVLGKYAHRADSTSPEFVCNGPKSRVLAEEVAGNAIRTRPDLNTSRLSDSHLFYRLPLNWRRSVPDGSLEQSMIEAQTNPSDSCRQAARNTRSYLDCRFTCASLNGVKVNALSSLLAPTIAILRSLLYLSPRQFFDPYCQLCVTSSWVAVKTTNELSAASSKPIYQDVFVQFPISFDHTHLSAHLHLDRSRCLS